MKTKLTGALAALLASAMGCGGITPDNVVEVTLEQAAETFPAIRSLVTERTAEIESALEDIPTCPEQQEQPFELGSESFGIPDARAWEAYRGMLRTCRYRESNLSMPRGQIETIRKVYEEEGVETTATRIRERVTPERLDRNNVNLERLSQADLPTRWRELHYIAFQRSYGFRRAGMLDVGTWPDVDVERAERLLDLIAGQVDDTLFDIQDAITDSNELYERMVRGDHRQ